MKIRHILVKLYNLHETRKSMAHHSIYHQQYVDKAIELNSELKALTGRDYTEFSRAEISDAIVEVGLQLEEGI